MEDFHFRFIDLFAGIGGFRIALEKVGGQCVFSSEINEHAIEMYEENFGDNPKNDITTVNPEELPDFDVLCAGFPCQSFSICGKQEGFNDATRGTLFFDICRILASKKPKAFILENVKNLEKHDKGNTLYVMIKSLNELGYSVSYKVLNAKNFGVPQNRERIIIVGNREGKIFNFDSLIENNVDSMYPFLDKTGEFEFLTPCDYTILNENLVKRQPKSGLIFTGYRNKKIRTAGVRENTEHLSRVHKQPNRIYSSLGIHPTLASQEQSGRYWILVDGKVRKLTINECYRFMGFPNDFKLVGSRGNLYERIGNSVCVPMIKEVADKMVKQFFIDDSTDKHDIEENTTEIIEDIYKDALGLKSLEDIKLDEKQKSLVKTIVDKEETLKGVYTVLVTSLIYKTIHPEQDVRLHQKNLEGGYSGRSFDTKYVTPFLKQKKFYGAMKESGWLTRSLEQNAPFDFNFPGKISNVRVKSAFLNILHDVEENNASAREYVKCVFFSSIKARDARAISIINPVEAEANLNISEILFLLNAHFYSKYKSRGASILPVIALYSVYQCMVKEFKRFEDKKLQKIASHYSCDRSSGNTGDIVVTNADGSLYEVVEVKFEIQPDLIMLNDAYNKIKTTTLQRYYILSTMTAKEEEISSIHKRIDEIRKEHGCQIIVNGVMATLTYYLRILSNTDDFLAKYTENLQNDTEINVEHKIAWNNIVKTYPFNKNN